MNIPNCQSDIEVVGEGIRQRVVAVGNLLTMIFIAQTRTPPYDRPLISGKSQKKINDIGSMEFTTFKKLDSLMTRSQQIFSYSKT